MSPQNRQIFIVDDDESVCRALGILLVTYGFTVDTFTSTEEFFRAVPNSVPGCLILDIHMPRLNGWETLKHLLTSGSSRQVIMISADKNGGLNKRALKAGAVGFLQKPFNDKALVDLIKVAVEKEKSMHKHVTGNNKNYVHYKNEFKMKKIILISIVAIICLSYAGISVYCAENKNGVFIFDYKKELALTDKQDQNLRDIITKFQSYVTDNQKELNGLQAELSKMTAESADLDKIKTKINDIAKIQAEATYESIAINRAIETELTGTQLTKWRSIQAEFVRNLQQAQNAASKTQEIKK